MAHSLGFYGDGISFRVVFSQSFWLRVLPGGACFVQPRWTPERRILGGGRHVVSLFDLSWTLLVGGGLLVPCSLPGPPVIRHSYKWLLCCLARVGGFSQCASPSSVTDPNPSCVLDIVLPYSPSCKWWFFLPKNVVSAPFPLHYLMPPKSYTWRIRWSENEGFWWVGLD